MLKFNYHCSTMQWKWESLIRVRLFATSGTTQAMEFPRPLLQGVFPTQGSNPGLPHCRQILYELSHKGNPFYTYWEVSAVVYKILNDTVPSRFPLLSCFLLPCPPHSVYFSCTGHLTTPPTFQELSAVES